MNSREHWWIENAKSSGEIGVFLGISSTSIHLMAVNKVCFRWISHNFENRSQKGSCGVVQRNFGKYMDLCLWARNKIATDRVGLRSRAKSNERKRKWSPGSSVILVMWRLFRLSNVRRSTLSGTPLVCLKSSEKFEKRTRKDNMTMRALTHQLKPAPLWPAKTSKRWVICQAALIWHRTTSFYSRTSSERSVVNDFFRQKMLLKRSKTMIWRCLNGSGKSFRQLAWAHTKVYRSCWRILWKIIKPFLIKNIRIFITRPEIYIATLPPTVYNILDQYHKVSRYSHVGLTVRTINLAHQVTLSYIYHGNHGVK